MRQRTVKNWADPISFCALVGRLLGACQGRCLARSIALVGELKCQQLRKWRGIQGKASQTEGAKRSFLNNIAPKSQGQNSRCSVKRYSPLEHTVFHWGGKGNFGVWFTTDGASLSGWSRCQQQQEIKSRRTKIRNKRDEQKW